MLTLPNNQLSYWERESFFRDVTITVVGSGIVGLNAALRARELEPRGRILVIDRGALPSGASTRNAGFACFGSVSELLDDLREHPADEVWQLVERRWRGLMRLRQRLGDRRIRYQGLGGYELFRSHEQERFESCMAAIPDFNRQLRIITGETEAFRPDREAVKRFGFRGVSQLIWNCSEGQLHPGEMMKALLKLAKYKRIELLNGVEVTALADNGGQVEVATAEGWAFNSRKVLVATNGFARQLFPEMDVRPARNLVLATAPVPGLRIRGSFHYDRGYYYFRNIGNRILLGGGRNLDPTGETTAEFGVNPQIREALLSLLDEVILPGKKIGADFWWSGILGIGGKKAPIVEAISKNLAVAVRLGGMGVAIGALVGEEGAEVLLSER